MGKTEEQFGGMVRELLESGTLQKTNTHQVISEMDLSFESALPMPDSNRVLND